MTASIHSYAKNLQEFKQFTIINAYYVVLRCGNN